MSFDDCYQLGQVIKTHGLKGGLILFLDVDDPHQYSGLKSFLLDLNGQLVPFFIENITIQGDKAHVFLEGCTSADEAGPLVGSTVYLPEDQLPPLKEGQYYFHQLVGFDLYNGRELIGPVQQIYQLPQQYLLGVMYQGVEVLIPTDDPIIESVDLKGRTIIANLPEGLLDIYLNP